MLYPLPFLRPIYKYIGFLFSAFYCYWYHNVFNMRSFNIRLYFAFYRRFWMEYCTPSRMYSACSRAACCFSCFVGVIPSYLYNSLAASLIMVFIVLQLARYSNCGCTPLFIFLIIQFCSRDVILYISPVLRIYIASKSGTSFLLSIMLRF